ncbi:MAG: GNAT family N-acetyltransferase [Planctomycetota bacterium]|jgi:GNAT superfamily N-acetyltransferase
MADVMIDKLDPMGFETIAHLYNQVFRPERDDEYFERRLDGRHNVLAMGARIDNEAVGFIVGMERTPRVWFAWLVGVLPDARRMGVASQLMNAAADWAKTRGYKAIRFECTNRGRAMMHFGIAAEYDVVGMRWDNDRAENLLMFEKVLVE